MKAGAKKGAAKKTFVRMNEQLFEQAWSDSWMDYSAYTRILLLIRADDDIKDQIIEFISEKPFLKLEYIEIAPDDIFDDIYWVYLHSNSEFRFLHDDLIGFSGIGDGINIQAIDLDNRILQNYDCGDEDSGMFFDIDPEDFDPDSEDNEDYLDVIKSRIKLSPVKIKF
jgi:hypothetical protein